MPLLLTTDLRKVGQLSAQIGAGCVKLADGCFERLKLFSNTLFLKVEQFCLTINRCLKTLQLSVKAIINRCQQTILIIQQFPEDLIKR